MEKGAGDDSARAVGMCDRFLTFLAKNLSMNRQKNITEGPRNGSSSNNNNNIHNNHAEEEEEEEKDEFAIQIEKAGFEFSREEDHKSIAATILEERNTDVSAAKAASEEQQEGEAVDHQVAAESVVQETKVRKSVTIKDDREEAGDKDAAAAKKSLFKKRQASSSQLGARGEDPKPPRRGLRPRMPAILRVPSNINERSTTFIEERKKSFGLGKPEK